MKEFLLYRLFVCFLFLIIICTVWQYISFEIAIISGLTVIVDALIGIERNVEDIKKEL